MTEDSYTEQEELLCRVWSAVCGYRAELIATERRLREARTEKREPDADLKEHLDTGTWQLARLLSSVSDYLDRYGEERLHSTSRGWSRWPAGMAVSVATMPSGFVTCWPGPAQMTAIAFSNCCIRRQMPRHK